MVAVDASLKQMEVISRGKDSAGKRVPVPRDKRIGKFVCSISFQQQRDVEN